jgi:divalent metal cation (Fe/Co/Zn/Cd) transporter
VGLTLLTGNGYWDVAGTAAIGVLLVVIAIILALEMSSLLIGEGAGRADVDRIEEALVADPRVRRLIHMKTLYLGPEELLVAAKLDLGESTSAEEVAQAIDAVELQVRQSVPVARVIYLEPDVYRADYRPEERPDPPESAGH